MGTALQTEPKANFIHRTQPLLSSTRCCVVSQSQVPIVSLSMMEMSVHQLNEVTGLLCVNWTTKSIRGQWSSISVTIAILWAFITLSLIAMSLHVSVGPWRSGGGISGFVQAGNHWYSTFKRQRCVSSRGKVCYESYCAVCIPFDFDITILIHNLGGRDLETRGGRIWEFKCTVLKPSATLKAVSF